MTTLELTNADGSFCVSLQKDCATIEEIHEFLVVPVLLAAGYQPETIREFYDDE